MAAIEENIIPAGFRARVDEIVRLLKRRDQVLHEVIAQLLDEETKAVLAGYTVTTFDQDAVGENLGLDITDNEGQFSFAFYAPREYLRMLRHANFAWKCILLKERSSLKTAIFRQPSIDRKQKSFRPS